jgi:hypothetical protein
MLDLRVAGCAASGSSPARLGYLESRRERVVEEGQVVGRIGEEGIRWWRSGDCWCQLRKEETVGVVKVTNNYWAHHLQEPTW